MSQDEIDVAASMVAAEVAAMKGNGFGSGSRPPVDPVPGISAEPIIIDGSSGLSSAPGAPDILRPQEEARAMLAAQAEAASRKPVPPRMPKMGRFGKRSMEEVEDDKDGPVEEMPSDGLVEVMPAKSHLAGSGSSQVPVDRGKPESFSTPPSSTAAVSSMETKNDKRGAMFSRKEGREKAQHEALQGEVARRPYKKPYHKSIDRNDSYKNDGVLKNNKKVLFFMSL